MSRWSAAPALLCLAACAVPPPGSGDAGADAGVSVPRVRTDHSLFWNDAALLDDPQVVSFARLMATVAPDGHGGRLLDAWFTRFSTTAHSERALPAQFLADVARAQGADPSLWDLSLLPFKVTGIHNRVDLARAGPGGHCGELRVSVASADPTLQPFHVLFLFQQAPAADDLDADGVHCQGTALRWARLSEVEGEELRLALRAAFAAGLTRQAFALAETVEFTLSPWEWRQWVKAPDPAGVLPFVFDNPPLFQQVDVEGLNVPGARRDAFLAWVAQNAEALDARRLLLPDTWRAPSVRVVQGVPRTPLSLAGLPASVQAAFPSLRQNLELVGCAACHTADADFVQTRPDRTVSPFYEKELLARERHLEALARGERPPAPFGPLQASPVLPP